MRFTSTAAESIHQKLLVVVLLTDYYLTTCNKGCGWWVSNNYENNHDNNYGNLFVYFVFPTTFD